MGHYPTILLHAVKGFSHSSLVQNADVNAKKSDYSDLKPDHLLVHNAFMTIQGEGPLAGLPAYFIRLGGCNFGAKDIACASCDTSFHLANSKPCSFVDLFHGFLTDAVYLPDNSSKFSHSKAKPSTPALVITGGEPCLQGNLPAFVDYIKARSPTTVVQIETNGSQKSVALDCLKNRATIVCSPKALRGKYVSEPPLGDAPDIHYKFVVTSVEGDAHHTLPEWAYNGTLDKSPVWVSPATIYQKPYQGEVASAWNADLVDQVATAKNYEYAARLALKHNLRVSIQMHSLLNLA